MNADIYFQNEVSGTFDEIKKRLDKNLEKEGFGIITEVNMEEKLKSKLGDVDIDTYRVYGVCNPAIAYKAINVEENIGVFLPCKVLIRKSGPDRFVVASFNAGEIMKSLENDQLNPISSEVSDTLKRIITNI